jgi:uncharacterized membrane protein YgcG
MWEWSGGSRGDKGEEWEWCEEKRVMKWAKSKVCGEFINQGWEMCGQEIKVWSFLNLNFIRTGESRGKGRGGKEGPGEAGGGRQGAGACDGVLVREEAS